MIGKNQTSSKFPEKKPEAQQMSLILKRVANKKPHVNLIVNKEMESSQTLQDSIVTDICLFKVEENGYYHISSQICVVNNDTKRDAQCNYIQFGVVEKSKLEEKCRDHMKCNICNSTLEPQFFIIDNLSCIMRLERDVEYTLFLNVGTASSLFYESENSHLNLYKL